MKAKKIFGSGVKFLMGVVVIAFLGLRSLDFFLFTTPADQWYLAWLGFGLTGGGVIGYLIILMTDARTDLQKTISVVMLVVCAIGEIATAGFGLQVEAWRSAGYVLQQEDFSAMVFVVQLLGFFHALALIGYIAGDKLIEIFGDEDGDGTPNFIDRDYKPKQQTARAFAADADRPESNPTNRPGS